ncbi:MAG: hypothetical protein ACK40O_12590 [Allosphingosinicella sp.]
MADLGRPRRAFAAGLPARPVTCTPQTPWGIHLSVGEHRCPRCGWAPEGRRAPPQPRDDVPIRA